MQEDSSRPAASADWRFYFRLLLLAAAVAAAGLLLWQLATLLLLAFAAVLVAVLLRALSSLVERFTFLGPRTSLALATVLIAITIAGFATLLGAQVQTQFRQLAERLPELMAALESRIGVDDLEETVVDRLRRSVEDTSILSNVAGLTSVLMNALAHLVLVLVAGIYLAADPDTYRRGLTLLFPSHLRAQTRETLNVLHDSLRLWLVGQLLDMVLVGILAAAGLWLLGVPSALALGLIAGLLEFIPILGPILAAIPAIAVGFSEGPSTAAWVAGLYLLIQQAEGNLIMPLIQQRMVRLPPVLTVFAILGFGFLFGPLGVLLATPLLVLVFVLVKKLWVRDALDEETKLPGEGH